MKELLVYCNLRLVKKIVPQAICIISGFSYVVFYSQIIDMQLAIGTYLFPEQIQKVMKWKYVALKGNMVKQEPAGQ